MGRECKTSSFLLNVAAAAAVLAPPPSAEEMLMKTREVCSIDDRVPAGNHKFNVMPVPKRLPLPTPFV